MNPEQRALLSRAELYGSVKASSADEQRTCIVLCRRGLLKIEQRDGQIAYVLTPAGLAVL
ncbi:MAG: hypothetical protein ABI809_00620 [Caldimonas sp.]